ncbi:MAG: hypothetical protein L6Q98_12950 [Anaerolineae bacterium]|nr:hypothetical protein [Anaerolineae bacterium]NUQ03301.1 hypothetical protein [Anaerolineae bacterium]
MPISTKIFAIALIALALGGCNFFSQPSDIQTENLQSELARTQIADIRATGTAAAERLAITVEFAQEAVQNAELQSTRIASTLIAQGTPFVELPEFAGAAATPEVAVSDVGQTPPTDSGLPAIPNPLITPGMIVTQGASARGDAPLAQPTPTPLISEQSDDGSSSLSSIQVSARVGANDCAVNPSTSFSLGITDLYVVATANVSAGATLSARWTREGVEVAYYEWTPDFNIGGACIWFHLPASDADLSAGNWAVQMAINDSPIGQPVAFAING